MLAVAKKKNERLFFIAGMCLLLVITGVVFKNYNFQKHANKLLAKEKEKIGRPAAEYTAGRSSNLS